MIDLLSRLFRKKHITSSASGNQQELIDAVRKEPLSASAHVKLARYYASHRMYYQAVAEFRFAQALDPNIKEVLEPLARSYASLGQKDLAKRTLGAIPEPSSETRNFIEKADVRPLILMNHNRYFRHRTLRDFVLDLDLPSEPKILDVGGGNGEFGLFLPNARYMVVDPRLNGIEGDVLPFKDKKFDLVMSCHVLEHIPPSNRDSFLKNLLRVTKTHVLLLNPFQNTRVSEERRFRMVLELTEAKWAREHLECTLPLLEDVKNYAQRRDIEFFAKPNGSLPTSLAFFFATHYARKAGKQKELDKINQYFNDELSAFISSEELPTDWTVLLTKRIN